VSDAPGAEKIGAALPDGARSWVRRAMGPGSRVERAEPLAGATSSAVHALVVRDRRGRSHDLVLRRYVLADWLAREPDLAEREAEVLALLEGCPVPTPRLVSADVTGDDLGVPGVLMTRLPGRTPEAPGPTEEQVDQMAALLPVLHATPVPSGSGLRRYRPYDQDRDLVPPVWSTDDVMWGRAIGIHRSLRDTGSGDSGDPGGSGVLLHRDYHPGNLLLDPASGEVSGLVDWASASRGLPDADVGHCRFNLVARRGRAEADRFRDRWVVDSGRGAYDPRFDITAVVGALGGWPPMTSGPRLEVEAFLAAAVAVVSA
jgi:aminoglycoside phosphotransferase (APT) family kinase protein